MALCALHTFLFCSAGHMVLYSFISQLPKQLQSIQINNFLHTIIKVQKKEITDRCNKCLHSSYNNNAECVIENYLYYNKNLFLQTIPVLKVPQENVHFPRTLQIQRNSSLQLPDLQKHGVPKVGPAGQRFPDRCNKWVQHKSPPCSVS